jgi:hypothetical protein
MRDLGLSYEDAAHGVQSAIKYELEHTFDRDVLHHVKHLRVGIDCRASDAMGLAELLIAKGVFTKLEYVEHMRLAINEELARYTEHLRKSHGLPQGVDFR